MEGATPGDAVVERRGKSETWLRRVVAICGPEGCCPAKDERVAAVDERSPETVDQNWVKPRHVGQGFDDGYSAKRE